MTHFAKCISLVSFGFAVAALSLPAQDYNSLPDDPGQAFITKPVNHDSLRDRRQAFLAKAVIQDPLLEDPGQPYLAKAADSEPQPSDPGQTEKPRVDATTGVPQREATWRRVPGDFLHDQKDLWTFPFQVMRGKHLVPVAIVLGTTIGLIYADPHVMPYFNNHQENWDKVNDVFDPLITTAEVIALPAGLLTAGYIRHDDREVNTAILAVEAYGDSVVIDLAMKAITRRQRPSDVAPNGNYSDTFFNAGKSPFKGSSFPSGHATAVWSVATVVAERYKNRGKPWIPVLCYTLATAISFSRITGAAHFPSDVWLGASLGYTIAKYQTLSPR
jgi:membrane-associated PAP2 superfamily phosphatase